jgi:hypothetical protein
VSHLETPAEVRRAEKYLCPICDNHRWYSAPEKIKAPAGGWSFREQWGCTGGCIGMTMWWAPEVEYFNIHMTALNAKTRRPEDHDDAAVR